MVGRGHATGPAQLRIGELRCLPPRTGCAGSATVRPGAGMRRFAQSAAIGRSRLAGPGNSAWQKNPFAPAFAPVMTARMGSTTGWKHRAWQMANGA